jgi:hypothetical protein
MGGVGVEEVGRLGAIAWLREPIAICMRSKQVIRQRWNYRAFSCSIHPLNTFFTSITGSLSSGVVASFSISITAS